MKNKRAYIPALIMLMIIFAFSSQNGTQSGALSTSLYHWLASHFSLPFSQETMTFLIRKCAHMTEFGILSLSWAYGLAKNECAHPFLYALSLTFASACLDEGHQLFVSGRAGQFTDCLIDSMGGLLFLSIEKFIKKARH